MIPIRKAGDVSVLLSYYPLMLVMSFLIVLGWIMFVQVKWQKQIIVFGIIVEPSWSSVKNLNQLRRHNPVHPPHVSQPESERAVGETSQTHGLMVMEVPIPLDVNNVSIMCQTVKTRSQRIYLTIFLISLAHLFVNPTIFSCLFKSLTLFVFPTHWTLIHDSIFS